MFNSEVYRAMAKQGEDTPPPDPGDLDGWRKVAESGRVARFSPESLVAALQDLGPGLDAAVRNPIAQHLNLMLMRWLRRYIGQNHPAGGEDVILRTHYDIFVAMLDKKSADGKALRVEFWARVSFRAKDAIAKEYRDSRIPLTHEPKKKRTANEDEVPLDEEKAAEVRQLVGPSEQDEEAEDVSGFVGDDPVSNTGHPGAALLEGLTHFEETMDVERVLAHIKDLDWRKRLAFRLHMEKVPAGSTKGYSIAKAVGRSSKTVEKWIKEIQDILKQTREVQELTGKKVGERS
ncbi:hypothetical protein [Bradyrhizobium sp. STM 3561]|uniref:hypothetical protein n=1 Tax=Bradyrhizobium sp. STM 3561 TaxID=578923 RepID=UPI00388DC469